MKTPHLILILIVITNSFFSFAQSPKTCESPEEELEVLNTISLKKCDITEKKQTGTRKVTTNVTRKNNNRISHYVRKNKKASYTNTKKTISKEFIFSIVDKVPLIKGCSKAKDRTCFNAKFYEHFSKKYNPESVSDKGFNKRVFVQFTIDSKGSVSDVKVMGASKRIKLINEITRIVNKLPVLLPAFHNGFPVNVKHSLPINLKSE